MIDYKKYTPEPNIPVIVLTDSGDTRLAILDLNCGGFVFLDCIHPMQNCYLPTNRVVKWRYKDQRLMDECRFVKNTYESRKVANEILSNIKKPNWWDRLKYRLKL